MSRSGLDITYQLRQRGFGTQADEHMDMIGHAVDCHHDMSLGPDDTGDVFMELLPMVPRDMMCPLSDGEDEMDVDLGVCVGHERCGDVWLKHYAPPGLRSYVFSGRTFSDERFPGERFPGERFPDERFPDERFPGERFPVNVFRMNVFPDERFGETFLRERTFWGRVV
jgi:hypothetical protein